MNIIRKVREVLRISGCNGLISILNSKYNLSISQSAKSKWKGGIWAEIEYWDTYFHSRGLKWNDSYGYENRQDPYFPLQPRPATLLPPETEIHILDVGAGPLTYLGKIHEGKHLIITAIDPLSDEYNRILDKYQVKPLVRTKKLAAEDLTKKYPSNTYDLVFARNCIDHTCNPEKAILQMMDVVKTDSYVLLEHMQNEAENMNYSGLHSWNFSLSADGDFIVSSKFEKVNITKKYAKLCAISSEIVNEGKDDDWLIVRIRKR